MNVLFITRKWSPAVGGMETYCVELVREFSAHDAVSSVRTIALPGRSDGRAPGPLALAAFGLRAAFAALFMRGRFDVLHGSDMAIWPLIWLARLSRPTAKAVLSAHGTDIAYASRQGLRAALYRAYIRLGARLMSNAVIIANSNATARLLAEHGYHNAAVVTLGAHIPEQTPPRAGDKPYLLFVGRLIRRKGCRWFVENVLPMLPDHITLKVAGAVEDPSEGERLDLDRVEHLGTVTGPALARLRKDALAVVIPNIADFPVSFEGFGLTTVEAAAAGGVVLASAVDGVADAVIDGETGFLLPPGDADAWSNKIIEIADWSGDERRRFVDRSVARIGRDFSWRGVADATLRAYDLERTDAAATPAPALAGQSGRRDH